ncbi:hypothetical protein OHC33_006357 [Knufia fluminis]|uniref:Acyl-coenzyme A oxidase n=1 Tax=Knufia fluminis TaxID=191047 RepID=A0AAN8ED43_9EURO|nr:hypothetical protein OHC33_006357 [Knufia fluminis]
MPHSRQRHIPKHAVETPLGLFLWGGQEKFDRRREVLETLSSNPIFSKGEVVYASLARKDVWTRTALQSCELIRIYLTKKWPYRTFMDAIRMTDWMLPVQPQFRIFMSNLERQMSDEQKAIWIPKAERFEIFGSYCQTELGHGSNVRGIETTATFDKENDEFVINSPTVSSTKYWIGATGVWATHGIVVARLIIGGMDYGNHLFLTQLRDLESQRLMPGVEIYELGPKAFQGMLGTDNGALQFHHVRVPRNQMLMRNAQVLRDGTYIKPKNEKHSYGSMVTVRALMAEITAHDLIRAAVTAYHYTTFRKQFKKSREDSHAEETTVFDYASVRFRLLPLLAQATTLAIVGQNIKRAYDDYTATMLSTGDTSQLEDLHLQTVGAKVYSTEITGKGVETCRIACGGHGYSALSGFGRMYAHAINAVTYEGDNYVIGQQVPRAILKHYKAGTYASLPSLSYLSLLSDTNTVSTPDLSTPSSWLHPTTQKWALELRLVNMVRQHISDTSAGIDTSYTSHALTMAHSDYVYWRSLQSVLSQISTEPYYAAMNSLSTVFALSIIFTPHHPSLAQALPLTQGQLSSLRTAYNDAITDMADNHVASIIEAWGLTEYEIDSALARSDQTPYEALLDGAKRSEMSGEKMSHLWAMMVDTRKMAGRIEAERKEGKAKL